jgi:hypothetical protein
MARSHTVTAEHTFDVEIGLSGTFCPGAPEQGPSYASGGQPADPDEIADMEITSVSALLYVRNKDGVTRWDRVNLLEGVDPKSEAYERIMHNIMTFMGDNAYDALINEAVEF